MKRYICIALSLSIGIIVSNASKNSFQNDSADSINIVEAINDYDGSVYVVQPQELDIITNHTSSHSKRGGYRIQVFSDNNLRTAKSAAERRKHAVESEKPGLSVTISFEAPYWRVRAGNFRTYNEANNMLSELKEAMPSFASEMRIVRVNAK